MRKALILSLIGLLAFTTGASAAQLTFWTTEEQPARIEVQERIAAEFEAATGIAVEVVPVTESRLNERVTAAFAAGALPDVVFHPINYTLGWAEAGVFDTWAATEVIEELGVETFGAGILEMAKFEGDWAAIPADGWTQLLVYRKDLFDAHGLAAPTTYEAILEAARTLHNPPEMYGFVAGTDPSEDYMMQLFEHFALANGARLLDDEGNLTIDTPEMIETLKFYNELAQMSPPGNLYWQHSRELYHAGRAAMMVWSPFVLDELAGLTDSAPVPVDADHHPGWLAQNSGIVTRVAGPNNPQGAGWGQASFLGITVDADTEAAKAFVKYLLNDGYLDWLSMAPEGKFPVRRGTPDDPDKFVEGWTQLHVGVDRRAPLGQFYSDEVIASLIEGLDTGDRWAFRQGEGALVTRIYGTRIMAELVRSYLDGERTAEETAEVMQQRIQALR